MTFSVKLEKHFFNVFQLHLPLEQTIYFYINLIQK